MQGEHQEKCENMREKERETRRGKKEEGGTRKKRTRRRVDCWR